MSSQEGAQEGAQDGAQARPLVLLWLNEAQRYLHAATEAGLTRSLELVTVPAVERPQPELLARAQGVVAWSLPPGIIPSMPKLRWIQTLSAGVERWHGPLYLHDAIN